MSIQNLTVLPVTPSRQGNPVCRNHLLALDLYASPTNMPSVASTRSPGSGTVSSTLTHSFGGVRVD